MFRLLPLLLAVLGLVAGEPMLPDEARASLLAQSRKVGDAGPGLAVVGAWIWSGRADLSYKPFFEWDLRLSAGSEARSGLRLRVATLGPSQEVLRQGEWTPQEALTAGEQRDLALRLNCPTFAAWRLEAAWEGGTEAFVGPDKQAAPLAIGNLGEPLLLAVNANGEPEKSRSSSLVVTWNLWNLGPVEAPAGAVQTVRLLGRDGKSVATGEVKTAKPVPPRGSLGQRLVMAKVPDYAGIAVQATMPSSEGGRIVLEQPPTSGADLVIRRLILERGRLRVELANRLGRIADKAVVDVEFAAKGKPVRAVRIPVPVLADGAETAAEVEVGKLPSWDAYTVGYWRSAHAADRALHRVIGLVASGSVTSVRTGRSVGQGLGDPDPGDRAQARRTGPRPRAQRRRRMVERTLPRPRRVSRRIADHAAGQRPGREAR